jgi:hypothetical protein
MHNSRPLIEIIEGAEQDNRQALNAAFYSIVRRANRRDLYDLHVREFLYYICAVDKSGDGVSLSYADIADKFLLSHSAARRMVQRASRVFGLVAVTEDRYVRGGQSANRYSIDWQAVKAVNQGLHEPHFRSRPAAQSEQPPAQSEQPPAQSEQPYKEPDRLLPGFSKDSSSTSPEQAPQVREISTTWRAVEEELILLGVVKAADACKSARENGATPDHVREISQWWQRSLGLAPQRWRSPGYALYVRICNARPSLDVDAGWLGCQSPLPDSVPSSPRASPLTDEDKFRYEFKQHLLAKGIRGPELPERIEQAVQKWRSQQMQPS